MSRRTEASSIAGDVLRGLTARAKWLPPHLFYDAEGSRLYELITELPEYYPTRTERAILQEHASDLVARAATTARPLAIVELGAGSATKTTLVLEATLRRQGRCVYVPIDVSESALDDCRDRLGRELPAVDVRPFVGHHEAGLRAARALDGTKLLLFIGSSIGNFDDEQAHALLSAMRESVAPSGALLLGTDLRKSPDRLVPAYDDAAGVTAAFNRNVLARINRELGGHFDLSTFRHVALWNEPASRIEMHLESVVDQSVRIDALDLHVRFRRGERIHTESSVKYDTPGVTRMLARAGLAIERTYTDDEALFAVHLARPA